MNKSLMYASAVALLALPTAADVWDVQTFNDDSRVNTRNQLLHGTRQTHDLGARPGPTADVDFYRMVMKAFASYEVIVDSASGDLGAGLSLQLVGGATTLDGGPAVAGAEGASLALRWASVGVPFLDHEFIRVGGADCGNHCGSEDVYTIRVRETTVNVPRFNNAGGQTTVLVVQNASEAPITAYIFFWDAAGVLLNPQLVDGVASIVSKGELVMNLAANPLLAGKSGSITIAHNGGYGALVVKAVSMEPASGFTFDTPGVYVPD